MTTEAQQLRKAPRIFKKGGVWGVKYLRVWDSEDSWTDWAQEYKRNVLAAHQHCEELNKKAPN